MQLNKALSAEGRINLQELQWTREPQAYSIKGDTLEISTAPHTGLWQRTYYHFRNSSRMKICCNNSPQSRHTRPLREAARLQCRGGGASGDVGIYVTYPAAAGKALPG